jgi:glutaredoxin 3
MTPITLYTTDRCSKCVGAKTLLARRGIEYHEINLARDPDGRAELVKRTGMYTFPQIMIGERTIGGFDELRAADSDGKLPQLLSAAA